MDFCKSLSRSVGYCKFLHKGTMLAAWWSVIWLKMCVSSPSITVWICASSSVLTTGPASGDVMVALRFPHFSFRFAHFPEFDTPYVVAGDGRLVRDKRGQLHAHAWKSKAPPKVSL